MTPRTVEKSDGWVVARLRALTTLVTRGRIAAAAGTTYEGKRDLYAAMGYPQQITLEMYRQLYERGGLAGRIVDAYPNQTWRGGGLITDDEAPDSDTEFEAAWFELEERLRLWPAFNRTDILAGLGDFACLLIGAPGELKDPLEENLKPEQISQVSPYSQLDVEVDTLVSDPLDPRFGMPEMYKFKNIGEPRADGISAGHVPATKTIAGREQPVHWSRVIHVADGILENEIFGQPRLRRVWNLFEDLVKITAGGGEASWRNAHRGYVIEIDKDVEMEDKDIKALDEQMDAFVHDYARSIAQRGAKTTSMGADVVDFGDNADAILVQISAATGIPHRILTGSERGQLASSQDRNNWNERIGDRRENYAEPQIVRPFVDRMIAAGVLPAPLENEYAVKWPEIKNLNEGEKAEVAEALANVNKAAGETVITRDEIRTGVLDLPPIAEVDDGENDDDEEDTLATEGDGDADVIPMPTAAARHKKKGSQRSAISARNRALKTNRSGLRFIAPRTATSRVRRDS